MQRHSRRHGVHTVLGRAQRLSAQRSERQEAVAPAASACPDWGKAASIRLSDCTLVPRKSLDSSIPKSSGFRIGCSLCTFFGTWGPPSLKASCSEGPSASGRSLCRRRWEPHRGRGGLGSANRFAVPEVWGFVVRPRTMWTNLRKLRTSSLALRRLSSMDHG